MVTVMYVKVESVDAAAYVAVTQNTLGTITERQYGYTVATNGDALSNLVHITV